LSDLPLVLDQCSGSGAASQPFINHGCARVVRVDIAGRPDVRGDIRHLPIGGKFKGSVAGTPCDDLTDVPWHEDLRVPERGVALFRQAEQNARDLGCEWFVGENVRGAQRWLGQATFHRGSRYFWAWGIGVVSQVEGGFGKWRLPPSPDRKALRSAWPESVAEAVHRAVCSEGEL
jgi:hypothetical protein